VIVLASRSDVSDVEYDVLDAAQKQTRQLDVTSNKSVEDAGERVKDTGDTSIALSSAQEHWKRGNANS